MLKLPLWLLLRCPGWRLQQHIPHHNSVWLEDMHTTVPCMQHRLRLQTSASANLLRLLRKRRKLQKTLPMWKLMRLLQTLRWPRWWPWSALQLPQQCSRQQLR